MISPARHPNGSMPYVLVADDEQPVAEMVRTALEDEGYRVAVARDGADALRMIETDPPDLVLADVMMPEVDGYTLTRTLRRRGARIPVVLMSAVYGKAAVPGVLVITKPFDLDVLLDELDRALHEESGQ
jgi:two-component system, OmpR family, response regulator